MALGRFYRFPTLWPIIGVVQMGFVEFVADEVDAGEYKLWATVGTLREIGSIANFIHRTSVPKYGVGAMREWRAMRRRELERHRYSRGARPSVC